jgi:hypothetical protein
VASLRGGRQESYPLTFVRRVPLVLPKRTLSGENAERIDTRVLQAIYRFDRDDVPLAPGQVLDVFIEAAPGPGAAAGSAPAAAPSPPAPAQGNAG